MTHVSRSAEGGGRFGGAFAGSIHRALLAPWAPVVAVVGALGAVQLYVWPYNVDDAHIVARYAARLAGGRGYTFNDGPPTDGVTSPLWLALCALCALGGADPLRAAKLIGAVAALLSTAQVVRSERTRALGGVAAWCAALLLATSVPLATWSVAGLETGAATLALTSIALAPGRAATLAAGSLAWLRPELVPAAVALAAWQRRRAAIVACLGGVFAVAAFRYALFGAAWPMTAAAKPAALGLGARYLADALRAPAALTLVLVALWAVRRVRGGAGLCAALAIHGLAVLLAGGDWMPAARLLAPVVPLSVALAARGLALLYVRRRRLAAAGVVGLLALRAATLIADLPSARARRSFTPELAALVAALPPAPGPLVALDIGWLGASVSGRIVDLGGLTEPRIARAPGGHLDKHVDGAWLEGTSPRALILHSAVSPSVDAEGRLRWFAGYPVERRVLAFPWVQRDFRVRGVFRYDASYFYVLLTRRTQPGR